MANEHVSKVVLSNGTTLIDLTADTITPQTLLVNSTAHDKSGAPIEGACTFDKNCARKRYTTYWYDAESWSGDWHN